MSVSNVLFPLLLFQGATTLTFKIMSQNALVIPKNKQYCAKVLKG